MLSILYPNMTDSRVIVLKTLLNEILKSNPPLVVNNRFDNQLQAAVIKFKSERNLFPCNATIDDATFDFIKQLLPTEKLRQIFNESIRNNSGDVSAISLIWNELIFQSDEQRQTDEIQLDDKIIDDLRGYLVKLMADPTFNRFISALIRNLPDKIYPDPNNASIGMPAAKFNGTIIENFDRIRKTGKFVLVSDLSAQADYKRNVIRFDRKYFKPYSNVIVNRMITSNQLYISQVKTDIGKGYQISEKLNTIFTLVHELIHAYYPATPSNSLATRHIEMAIAAKAALAELGIVSIMTNMSNSSDYFNAALFQVCGKVKL